MRKKIIYLFLIFQLFLIISLVKNIQFLLNSRGRVSDLSEQKKKLEQETDSLKQQLEYVKSDYYLEKVAREELQLAKPGETLVIVPESLGVKEGKERERGENKKEKQNWQKWWEVLAGERS